MRTRTSTKIDIRRRGHSHFKMNYTSKRDMAEQINSLEKHEQEDVFQILHRHGVFFSSNVNGIFINMKHVKPVVLNEIEEFLASLMDRKERMATIFTEAQDAMAGQQMPDEAVREDDFGKEQETAKEQEQEQEKEKENEKEPTVQEYSNEELGCGMDIPLSDQERITLQSFCQNIRSDRPIARRNASQARFSVAKKKYARAADSGQGAGARGAQDLDSLDKQSYLLV